MIRTKNIKNHMSERSPLLPERHSRADLFFCDIADAVIKSDMASMEHPIFVLSTKPYMKRKRYERDGNWLEVAPSDKGIANIYDKDILIYAISQIMAAKNQGKPYSKHVSFVAYDFLVFANKGAGGKDYRALKDSLTRLGGTRLETNIRTGNEEITFGFGLIESYIIRKERLDGRILEWRVTLSDWLFNAIKSNEVLSLNPDYFRLRKPIERRLYEIARKHCGIQKEWRISLEKLKEKCGSGSPKGKFKFMLKNIVEYQHLPDYHVDIIDNTVLFTRVGQVGTMTLIKEVGVDYSKIPPLKTTTFEKFKKAHKNYDPYFVEAEWRSWAHNKETPKNPDAAFLAFAKAYTVLNPI